MVLKPTLERLMHQVAGGGDMKASGIIPQWQEVRRWGHEAIRMANPLYTQILKNGPFTPMVRVDESTGGDMVISAHYAPKDPSEVLKSEVQEPEELDKEKERFFASKMKEMESFKAEVAKFAEESGREMQELKNHTEQTIDIVIPEFDHMRIAHVVSIGSEAACGLSPDYVAGNGVKLTLDSHISFVLFQSFTASDYVVAQCLSLYMLIDSTAIYGAVLRAGQGHVVDGSSALIEQVILELEEDEFYALDELDQSMAYLARKFSNIKVKKPRFFKGKGQSFNKDNSWKGKGKYTPDSKNGYKTGSVDRSKISKAYISERKSWDDSDNDEDDEVGNYAFMDLEQGESSSSKAQVPTLTTIDLNKLENEKQEIELFIVEFEAVKQENAYLKNKLKCANEIEAVLRENLEKNEVKLKSFRNASELVGQYHEKNKPCANIAIGLDYDALNNKKKEICGKGKTTENEDVSAMLKKVGSPMFKACEVDFSEEELIIKQEIADEDNEK
ncbi:hypothetical protein AgCh_026289 [Apium graveolens]